MGGERKNEGGTAMGGEEKKGGGSRLRRGVSVEKKKGKTRGRGQKRKSLV